MPAVTAGGEEEGGLRRMVQDLVEQVRKISALLAAAAALAEAAPG